MEPAAFASLQGAGNDELRDVESKLAVLRYDKRTMVHGAKPKVRRRASTALTNASCPLLRPVPTLTKTFIVEAPR